MTGRLNIASVNALLGERMGDLARELEGTEPTDRRRDEWRFRPKGSLAVMVGGSRRGVWHDFKSGCGGDPLGLIAHLRRIPMREAFRWALAWLGELPPHTVAPDARPPVALSYARPEASDTTDVQRRWSVNAGRTLWREAMPGDAPGSLVPVYLAVRGLAWEPDAPIRFHPHAWRNLRYGPYGPAMVALMTDPATGDPCGAHVTYLQPDGTGKAEGERKKIMLGAAGVIRLVPDTEVTMGLGLAEGIETALATMQRGGWRPVWAATSAGAIERFPVLPGIEALTVFADSDRDGMAAARTCCRRWADAGREARILAPPAGDWDDALPRPEGAR
jgi:putative DNA primase/helicase